MKFKSAARVEEVVWNMKLAEARRSADRARIVNLFNGVPPYTEDEMQKHPDGTNVNFKEGTKLDHDARRQFSNAFQSPGNFFTVQVNDGPADKRRGWSETITGAINKRMKENPAYFELLDTKFAQVILHGIGPVSWADQEKWCPGEHDVGDFLFPAKTLRSFANLEYFAIFRKYTAWQLWRWTHKPTVDGGWNMPLVDQCLQWAHRQHGQTLSSGEYIYAPEKWAEDYKEDGGVYASDQTPTIDCWDFFFFDDEGGESGWKRRIVLDTPKLGGGEDLDPSRRGRGQWLYNSGERIYAPALGNIFHCQFGDASAVAPFRVHNVRSLGYMLYEILHLQNRLRCRLMDSAFEAMLQYIRRTAPGDSELITHLELLSKGILPDGVSFVPQNDRWQVNERLVQMVLQMNRQTLADNSASFTQDFDFDRSGEPETATGIMAKVNNASALVASMLQRAYTYQEWEYREDARRFCIRDSNDPDAKAFQTTCLKGGVPLEMLDVERWTIKAERIIGGGNTQLAIAQAKELMAQIHRYDPDSQRLIVRDFTYAVTQDAARTEAMVPFQKNQVSDSVHDAQLSAATLLHGLPMGLKQGVNHGEYAATLLVAMAQEIEKVNTAGKGMATMEQVAGLQNIAGVDTSGKPTNANGVQAHIQILAGDPERAQEVKVLKDMLGNLMNQVKAFIERLQEAAKAQAKNNGGVDPEAMAKVQATTMQARANLDMARQKMAMGVAETRQKLMHKDAEFQQAQQQTAQKHALDMRTAEEKAAAEKERAAKPEIQ